MFKWIYWIFEDCYEKIDFTTYGDFTTRCDDDREINSRSVESSNQELTVYPNPASTEITVDVSHISDRSVVILRDLSGSILTQRKIKTESKKITLDVSLFPSGMYIIEVLGFESSSITKFVKQ